MKNRTLDIEEQTLQQPRLSIIIPFYNVEQYIAQCLDSVYQQDIPEDEYEVICVDDCSPDNSLSIVEGYAKQHSNLIVVKNKINRKLGGARNAGMDVAKGKYIWFVDSDDFIASNCFANLLSIAELDDLDMLHFNYACYPNNEDPTRRPSETEVMTGTEMFFDPNFIWYHDLVTAWRKLYKRQFLLDNNIQFAEHIMFEDNDYAIEAFAYAQRVKHIPFVAYHYRNNPNSITRLKYSSCHIVYWFKLCNRLCELKTVLINKERDLRYQQIITNFIRYLIEHILSVNHQMDITTKRESFKIIQKSINLRLLPYMSKCKFIKIKLGIF